MFRDVLIPHIKPALVAGALAFTLSLDDFVITYFTSGPDTITFPVKVYSMVRFSVTPEVNAASTLLIILSRRPDLYRAQGPGRESHCGDALMTALFSVRVERSRDTLKASAADGNLDFARCERR